MKKQIKPVFRLLVQGPGVRHGIDVPILVKICEQAQTVVNRQAEALEGKPTLRPGPITAKAQSECTLKLVRYRGGSADLGFTFAKPQQHLPATISFADDVVRTVAETVLAFGRKRIKKPPQAEIGVLDSLNYLGQLIDRKSITSVTWKIPARNGHKGITATFNEAARGRVLERLRPPAKKSAEYEGVLEMADFREADLKCRILPTLGSPLQCSFEESQADEIYAALRNPVRISGEASIDSQTGRVQNVKIDRLEPLEPLALGAADFYSGKSIAELIEAQGIKPMVDIGVLAGGLPDDLDVDAMVEEIYQDRKL